mmetsp:Transcript_36592/g.117340  ORF Transcript_36592/g.117340 Transcript_36592/m.117340 type:complete len:317 (+) Transcript_36592:194-1144(+)
MPCLEAPHLIRFPRSHGLRDRVARRGRSVGRDDDDSDGRRGAPERRAERVGGRVGPPVCDQEVARGEDDDERQGGARPIEGRVPRGELDGGEARGHRREAGPLGGSGGALVVRLCVVGGEELGGDGRRAAEGSGRPQGPGRGLQGPGRRPRPRRGRRRRGADGALERRARRRRQGGRQGSRPRQGPRGQPQGQRRSRGSPRQRRRGPPRRLRTTLCRRRAPSCRSCCCCCCCSSSEGDGEREHRRRRGDEKRARRRWPRGGAGGQGRRSGSEGCGSRGKGRPARGRRQEHVRGRRRGRRSANACGGARGQSRPARS